MERTRTGHTAVRRVTPPESPGASPWGRDDSNDAGSSFLAGIFSLFILAVSCYRPAASDV
jgi:hypothetical protein